MNAEEIAHMLGKAKRAGRGWSCLCPAHDDRSPSLSLMDGDNGRLVWYCHSGCTQDEVRRALAAMGALDASSDWKPDTPEVGRVRRERREREERERLDRISKARSLWGQAEPIAGTVAETYVQSRGLEGPFPDTLRFLPDAVYQPGLYLPALVAAVARWPGRDVIAVHRTFLTLNGSGKAGVASPKKMFGDVQGGAVRLAAVGNTLAVAEGIETALSVQQATGLPTWAALTAGGIERLILPDPPLAEYVTIAADNDPTGLAAADRAASIWTSDGRTVRIAAPEEEGADFNDFLQRSA